MTIDGQQKKEHDMLYPESIGLLDCPIIAIKWALDILNIVSGSLKVLGERLILRPGLDILLEY